MAPQKPLPYDDKFTSPDEYVSELLNFVASTDVFQILCGGVHILDFFTIEPGLFHAALPREWHPFLLSCDIMRLIDILAREDLDNFRNDGEHQMPESLLIYIKSIRRLSLNREYAPPDRTVAKPTRSVSIGMKPKKIHEVANFADYVDRLSYEVASHDGSNVTHFVDFGSGQNYLGRALASEPYNRHVVAVEGRENNVSAAKGFDMSSGLSVAPQVRRNKKAWDKIRKAAGPGGLKDPERLAQAIKDVVGEEGLLKDAEAKPVDFRARNDLDATYTAEDGKGFMTYISGRLESGDLSGVISDIEQGDLPEEKKRELRLMAVSIHSCGNLSHFAIRSLVMNPDMRAVAIVGCCYNLLTEKLGAPTYKHPFLRPTLQAINGRVTRESEKNDPEGFPMSKRFSEHNGDGVRLNITARMMACQALQNWTAKESEGFFTRHFFRAVAQKMFLDRGVVQKIRHRTPEPGVAETPFDLSTSPVIVGSLRNSCYDSLKSYVRGAVDKIINNQEVPEYAELMREKMGSITDEEIEEYEKIYLPRKKELSVIWTLMAFSAIVVESLIVTDRWTFLKEQQEVDQAWVEPVFDFKLSPRNLVVVGIKK
ncbi:Methyltransferase-like protein-like protein [Emericellopsis cladophorae]|uniref:Methyltransferase-like protein-like protein n=1 Tax=Emericellopsis cladophorae TaxID=2686198 RepID=A0A9P9Y450_9HYPO|nr:Methyltransferase-like protein-like protein [Emericellopsis cladophorae]KAI6782995.1 Methyltransferase-like protein-like protein [Emericellopsis cladophorae]